MRFFSKRMLRVLDLLRQLEQDRDHREGVSLFVVATHLDCSSPKAHITLNALDARGLAKPDSSLGRLWSTTVMGQRLLAQIETAATMWRLGNAQKPDPRTRLSALAERSAA